MPLYRKFIFPAVHLVFDLAAAQTTPASPVLAYKEWKSIGCQKDSTAGRILKHLVTMANSNTVTVELCLDACAAGNYSLGGVEFGHECFCGNALLYKYLSTPACTLPCSGNSSEICGGSQSLNVYQNADRPFTIGNATVLPQYGQWFATGCIEENIFQNQRLLPNKPKTPIPTEEMTVERCIDGCEAAGYNTAGLEYGQECHCRNVTEPTPSGWESTSPFECDLPCLGNATEICGGSLDEGRISAYMHGPLCGQPGAPPIGCI
ncbi:WSC domain-containing protein [Mycena sp. CBHHK59/15]|nr:WSC domain-containing protein [Mycena sp. CBHHK59/15]